MTSEPTDTTVWLPTRLLKAKWPPNSALQPGAPRFDALLDSIRREGIRELLTIDLDWTVIDGHHRLAAARVLGIEAVRVRIWTGTEMLGGPLQTAEPPWQPTHAERGAA